MQATTNDRSRSPRLHLIELNMPGIERRYKFFLEDAEGNLIVTDVEMSFADSVHANLAMRDMGLPYKWFPLEDF